MIAVSLQLRFLVAVKVLAVVFWVVTLSVPPMGFRGPGQWNFGGPCYKTPAITY
jgi:hypothetical protein